MFTILRWMRKRREDYLLTKELKASETERRIQREKREDQQAHDLLLALYELRRTMDPLIATQAYNNRFCPLISRLPEELLLCVIDFLCDDVVALHSLRIVSRIFLRLLYGQSPIWKGSWYVLDVLSMRGNLLYLHGPPRLQFRRLLQRDGRCKNCTRWNDATEHALVDDCKFQQNYRFRPGGTRLSCLYRRLYCYACHTDHDICQFSSTHQQSLRPQPERRCLGQQGSVQLCEHVQITWASIQAHIDDWRQQQREGDWQACLDSFNIECHDASHDTRCTVSEAPTWPRARLGIGQFMSGNVVLNLEWAPHSRIDALALTADGRIPAPELRALFRRLRSLGPADFLCPPCRPGALPEMAFFSPSSSVEHLVYYETGEYPKIRTPPGTFSQFSSYSWLFWHHGHGCGHNGKRLDIRSHHPRGASGNGVSSQCLVISYEKDIMICETTAMTDPAVNIIPTDHWLHAMDTQTYPHPKASHIRPQCRDVACTNYYRRQKDFYACPPADDFYRILQDM
ncbi:hypothetical protein J1614_005425 [Plenodomus biglobosus]|nr:hypothetical protein J1614_005425 [Plenodomus biglobosus]